MEKLNPNAFGLSSGIFWLACYLLVLILFLIAPKFTVDFLSQLAHVDLTIFTKVITAGSVILGIVARFINGYVLGYGFAWIYNWFTKEEQPQ